MKHSSLRRFLVTIVSIYFLTPLFLYALLFIPVSDEWLNSFLDIYKLISPILIVALTITSYFIFSKTDTARSAKRGLVVAGVVLLTLLFSWWITLLIFNSNCCSDDTDAALQALGRTVAGADLDQNGIRDDIDEYIQLTFTETAEIKAAEQYARAVQHDLVNHDDKEALMEYLVKGRKAMECLNEIFGNEGNARLTEIKAKTLNTQERSNSYLEAISNFDGNFYSLSGKGLKVCEYQEEEPESTESVVITKDIQISTNVIRVNEQGHPIEWEECSSWGCTHHSIQTTYWEGEDLVSIADIFEDNNQWFLVIEHGLYVDMYSNDAIGGKMAWRVDKENRYGLKYGKGDVLPLAVDHYYDGMCYDESNHSCGDIPQPLANLQERIIRANDETLSSHERFRLTDDIFWPFVILLNEEGEIIELSAVYVE